jgi:flagellar biosynthesis protein FlhG
MSVNANHDQAEGLRRIVAESATRQLIFLSALSTAQKNAVLLNLAAALVRGGSEVQLLDASLSEQGISSRAAPALRTSLWEMAQTGEAMEVGIRELDQGIRLSKLSAQPVNKLIQNPSDAEPLRNLLREMSPAANFWLIDSDIEADNPFVIPELANGDLIVLASNMPTSIKNAYSQVKAFHANFGRRPFFLLMVGVTAAQAEQIGHNMALAASRYLGIKLSTLGSIPADEHLSRSVQLGRSIVEAFPMAKAAIAFREIAAQLSDPIRKISIAKSHLLASPPAMEA